VKMHAKKQYVYVGNLPNSYEETDVQDLFAEYGVVNVNMVKDAQTLEFRGFAFVEVC
jgi:RNA recognition motif-containing protein